MPNWNEVLKEISNEEAKKFAFRPPSSYDIVRRKYLKKLHQHTNRNLIAYYSGFLSKSGRLEGLDINDDDKNGFMATIHELDRAKGLDLILHTPGGNIAATESLVNYLKQMFGADIRAVIPQIAMSAGTMIACSCKSIVMGKHSNLGPVDPQLQGIPAVGVKAEVERAYKEIKQDPARAHIWAPILQKYPPTFLNQCENAIKWSEEFVKRELANNMFSEEANRDEKAGQIFARLSDLSENKAHNKHFHIDDCSDMGLKIEKLENDPKLQDLVLTVHHCFIHTLSNTTALKIIENHKGQAIVKHAPLTAVPQ